MKKQINYILICTFLLSPQLIAGPLKKKKSRTFDGQPSDAGAGAAQPHRTRSESDGDKIMQRSSDSLSRLAAEAAAHATASKHDLAALAEKAARDISALQTEIEAAIAALKQELTRAQNDTHRYMQAAQAAATQASASQAQTQNMTAIVMVIGAYCMYLHIKENKKEKQPQFKQLYRKMFMQVSKQLHAVKQSQQQIKTFCTNCLPRSISSFLDN